MHTHPKILCHTLDHKITYNKHIDNTAAKLSKIISMLKSFNKTSAIICLQYMFTYCNRSKNIKIQTIKRVPCITAGYKIDTSIQHLHDETNIPLRTLLKLNASRIRNHHKDRNHPTRPPHSLTRHKTPRQTKKMRTTNITRTPKP